MLKFISKSEELREATQILVLQKLHKSLELGGDDTKESHLPDRCDKNQQFSHIPL